MSSTRQERAALQSPFQVPLSNQAAMEPIWALMQQSIIHTQPLAQSLISMQLEALAFTGARARARIDYATKLTSSRTPQSVAEATTDFWQDAARDYADFGQHCMRAWQQAFTMALTPPPGVAGPIRDLLTVPDPTAAKPERSVTSPAADKRRAA